MALQSNSATKAGAGRGAPRLVAALRDIGRDHRQAILERAAMSVLGSSVIRVFEPKTKDVVVPHLAAIDVSGLPKVKSQEAYRRWFERELDRLATVIAKFNGENPRVNPGLKWGHATKVLCLYVRDVVLCSRYFADAEAARIGEWLYVPVDGIVMRKLKELGVRLPFARIKDIGTPKEFYLVQDTLGEAAGAAGVPRVWFDDVWGSRRLAGRGRGWT